MVGRNGAVVTALSLLGPPAGALGEACVSGRGGSGSGSGELGHSWRMGILCLRSRVVKDGVGRVGKEAGLATFVLSIHPTCPPPPAMVGHPWSCHLSLLPAFLAGRLRTMQACFSPALPPGAALAEQPDEPFSSHFISEGLSLAVPPFLSPSSPTAHFGFSI